MNNRTLVVEQLVTHLKEIDADVSPWDSAYTFSTNLYNNVFRGLKYLDEINDFPAIYISCNSETRRYQTSGLTEVSVRAALRCYIYSDDSRIDTLNLAKDVEHVIYNMINSPELRIMDIVIDEIVTDTGLLEPYGMVEVFLTISFEK